MTTTHFRKLVRKLHPDAVGSNRFASAYRNVVRTYQAQRGRFGRCQCGAVIRKSAKSCQPCSLRRPAAIAGPLPIPSYDIVRHNRELAWLLLAGRIALFLILAVPCFAQTNKAGRFDDLKAKALAVAKAAAAPLTYSATFAWDASTSPGVTNYTLFYGSKSGMYTNSVACGTNLQRQLSGFTGQLKYFTAVRAEANGTNSVFSNEINLTLPILPPSPPTVITFEAKDITVPNAPWLSIGSVTVSNKIGSQIFRVKAQ